ncbi:MAG: hypothetical protein ACFFDN_00425 [Candidatus Hodarchaeota archaeon]
MPEEKKKEYVDCPNCKMYYLLPNSWKKQAFAICPNCNIYFDINNDTIIRNSP